MGCVPFTAADADAAAYAELREACRRHRFLPSFREGLLLDLAMVSPGDEGAVAAIRRLTHQEVRRFPISREDFERAAAELDAAAGEGGPALEEAAPAPACPESWGCHGRPGREVAAELVRFAHACGASDLLLDEQERWMDVAVKIDGRKEILPPVEKSAAGPLLRAFKEIAGLSARESPRWQSGAASFPVGGGGRAELRIEIAPTVHGESLAARLQDRAAQLGRMRGLPFADPAQRELVRACLGRSQGLILATGPTGQGKTSTLYACLGQLDRSVLNIRTLEDPVEFPVPWITQIPVGAGTGRAFGEGLKSLLRQAPDVILLGEIRDGPAARTCAEAVETGHLVLATLHTRDAPGAAARLLDLGLSGRQVASSLLLVIGQRLLRRLCPRCRRAAEPTAGEARHFERHRLAPPARLFRPAGCPECGGRGERGRIPVFELFQPAEALEDLLLAEPFEERALRRAWIAAGGSPLVREGLRLAAAGEVAYAEAGRHERLPEGCFYPPHAPPAGR
ncbi:MAG TPA: ATPase, T2SS/T4P/T4SS family [Opitutaceae bacterium]|nr:ATPase, T2SS/T4P/T4SS family [Opitutaceae bacterium]